MTIKMFEAEVADTINKAPKFQFPEFKYVLHGPDFDLPIAYPIFYEIHENYNNAILPDIYVEFLINAGDYINKILPNLSNLEITISKKLADKTHAARYNFVALNIDKNISTSRYANLSKSDADEMDLVKIKAQCVDPIMPVLKQLIISGIFKDKKLEPIVKYYFANELSKIKVSGKPLSYTLFFREFDNQNTYDHVVIKYNTKLVKLVHDLQNGDYGIYKAGINNYFKQVDENNYYVYIYPLFDYEVFNTVNENKLVFYSSTNLAADKHEKTFYNEPGSRLFKLATTHMVIEKVHAGALIEGGNGLNINDPLAAISKNYTNVTDDKITYSNVASNVNKSLGPSNNIINPIFTNFDANTYKFKSDIYARYTLNGELKTNNVNIEHIRPGMLTRYIYVKDNSAEEVKGVLQAMFATYNVIKKENSVVFKFKYEPKGR
jgi:hypothetical protein